MIRSRKPSCGSGELNVRTRTMLTWVRVKVAAALLACVVGHQANAAVTYLVDLNTNSNLSAGGAGGTWNAYATPGNITGATLVDSTNASSLVTLSVAAGSIITDNTANFGTAVFDPNQAGHAGEPAWVSNDAAGDNFFTNNATTTQASFTLTFGNLTAGSVVSVDLLASRNSGSAKGFFEYSVDGGSTWLGFNVLNGDGSAALTDGWDTKNTQTQAFILQSQGFVLHRYMNASNVTLTGTTLDVRTTDADAVSSTFSAMNAMQVVVEVPEPGMGVLVVMALGLLGRRGRN